MSADRREVPFGVCCFVTWRRSERTILHPLAPTAQMWLRWKSECQQGGNNLEDLGRKEHTANRQGVSRPTVVNVCRSVRPLVGGCMAQHLPVALLPLLAGNWAKERGSFEPQGDIALPSWQKPCSTLLRDRLHGPQNSPGRQAWCSH